MLAVSLFIALHATCICSSYDANNSGSAERMKRQIRFLKRTAPPTSAIHEVIISVKQQNRDVLAAELLSRSTPTSNNFQKWLTFEQVGKISSNPASADIVIKYLKQYRINVTKISSRSDYIHASAPVNVWERILSTKFYVYEDTSKDLKFPTTCIRTQRYALPKAISEHVDYIFNTVQLPPTVTSHEINNLHPIVQSKRKALKQRIQNKSLMRTSTIAPQDVTISFLNNLYSITSNNASNTLSQSVFQTNEQYFSQQDLTFFQQLNGITVQAAELVGGYETSSCSLTADSGNDCFEANLDTQHIMGISQQTLTKVWHVGSSNGQDPFLAWIIEVSNDSNPPSVNSISWGSDEQTISTSTMDSFNVEAMKLGLMGVTILVSSGDNGVLGYGCKSGCNSQYAASQTNCVCDLSSSSDSSYWSGSNSWSGTGYAPKFPATSPYVTVVGGTSGPEKGSPEVAAQSNNNDVITSGGGFSTHFAQPSWQTSAVSNYFSTLATSPANGYNSQGRGYPDVSLIAVGYVTVIQGTLFNMYGTSASAPVFAGMISLVNAERERSGKGTVGFINPALYSAQSTGRFNDISSGSNKCCGTSASSSQQPYCCTSGFDAAIGWDPVTGFGSISYANLLAILG